eukprot:354237-Chlamydomonas_euryale.AAC.7
MDVVEVHSMLGHDVHQLALRGRPLYGGCQLSRVEWSAHDAMGPPAWLRRGIAYGHTLVCLYAITGVGVEGRWCLGGRCAATLQRDVPRQGLSQHLGWCMRHGCSANCTSSCMIRRLGSPWQLKGTCRKKQAHAF